jgi:aminoglycoside 6'-N-acetyltransferase I
MEVRIAREEDVGAVVGLITQFFAGEGFSTSPEVVAGRAPQFLADPHTSAFLALDGDDAIGIATVSTSFGFECGRLAEVEDLYVVPAHRGKGVATTLLGEAMLWSKAQGHETLQVIVTPEDASRKQELIRWYARLGYHDTSRLVLHFGEAGTLS